MAQQMIPTRHRTSIPEAAQLLRRSHYFVYSRVLQGLIRGERAGNRRWVIDARDVARFLAAQREQEQAKVTA